MKTVYALMFAFGLLAACIAVFVWVSRRVRKGGGGATVGGLGAIHEMLSSDRRKAAETIVERNTRRTEEDETSSEPLGRAEQGADGGGPAPPDG